MAPLNRTSMADGPALKLFQSILTSEPIALAKYPLALPTMAWGWVMLGKAPTLIVVCATRDPVIPKMMVIAKIATDRVLFLMTLPSEASVHGHGKHDRLNAVFLILFFGFARR